VLCFEVVHRHWRFPGSFLKLASDPSPPIRQFTLLAAKSLPPRGTNLALLGFREGVDGEQAMLKWALIFFLISIVAGFFGFSGVSSATAGIAKILFIGAIIVAIIIVVAAISVGQAVF
jgi:uncharacterized membrane protein YtjA (UPF0391 family)